LFFGAQKHCENNTQKIECRSRQKDEAADDRKLFNSVKIWLYVMKNCFWTHEDQLSENAIEVDFLHSVLAPPKPKELKFSFKKNLLKPFLGVGCRLLEFF
jgi:hypothetical protein